MTARRLALAVFSSIFLGTSLAQAFPSWMGNYGEHVPHNGGNPGTFTVLMDQDYWGFNAEVGYRVGNGSWSVLPMYYAGNVDGNSKWQVTPGFVFPEGVHVEFYFHGWDGGGGHIWANNGGSNYHFDAGGAQVYWLGNMEQSPAEGDINLDDDVTLSLQSWPRGGVVDGGVLFSLNNDGYWRYSPLNLSGQAGNNDLWAANLGSFNWNTLVQYAAYLKDGTGTEHWDNNGGLDYTTRVNRNPSLSANGDVDGDGLPNGYEYDINFDPENPMDGHRDADGDGLSNSEEYANGTLMHFADTDGDGVSDYVEVVGTGTSPTSAQGHSYSRAASAYVLSPDASVGAWAPEAGAMVSQGVRGSLAYTLNVPTDDLYFTELEVSGTSDTSTARILINGAEVGHAEIPSDITVPSSLYVLACYLPAGEHTLEFQWDNTYGYNQLKLHGLSLARLQGADTDANGLADWAENILLARNTFRVLPETSYVSPAFIEGKCAFVDQVSINGGTIGALPSATGWYGNVPLSGGSATPVSVSLENEGVSQSVNIAWKPFNLYEQDAITVRVGDSLRFVAHDPQLSPPQFVSVNGEPEQSVSATSPYEHTFSAAGSFPVTGRYQAADANGNPTWLDVSATVTVVGADLNDTPAICRMEATRPWTAGTLGAGTVLAHDPNLHLFDAGFDANGQPTFELGSDRYLPRYLEARAGDQNGAIIDTAEVGGVSVYGANHTWQSFVGTLPDGTERIEVGVVTYPLRDNIQIKMKTLAAGVTFEDGTVEKWLDHTNFDETGTTSLILLWPPDATTAPCHLFEVYQGNTKISH